MEVYFADRLETRGRSTARILLAGHSTERPTIDFQCGPEPSQYMELIKQIVVHVEIPVPGPRIPIPSQPEINLFLFEFKKVTEVCASLKFGRITICAGRWSWQTLIGLLWGSASHAKDWPMAFVSRRRAMSPFARTPRLAPARNKKKRLGPHPHWAQCASFYASLFLGCSPAP